MATSETKRSNYVKKDKYLEITGNRKQNVNRERKKKMGKV